VYHSFNPILTFVESTTRAPIEKLKEAKEVPHGRVRWRRAVVGDACCARARWFLSLGYGVSKRTAARTFFP